MAEFELEMGEISKHYEEAASKNEIVGMADGALTEVDTAYKDTASRERVTKQLTETRQRAGDEFNASKNNLETAIDNGFQKHSVQIGETITSHDMRTVFTTDSGDTLTRPETLVVNSATTLNDNIYQMRVSNGEGDKPLAESPQTVKTLKERLEKGITKGVLTVAVLSSLISIFAAADPSAFDAKSTFKKRKGIIPQDASSGCYQLNYTTGALTKLDGCGISTTVGDCNAVKSGSFCDYSGIICGNAYTLCQQCAKNSVCKDGEKCVVLPICTRADLIYLAMEALNNSVCGSPDADPNNCWIPKKDYTMTVMLILIGVFILFMLIQLFYYIYKRRSAMTIQN